MERVEKEVRVELHPQRLQLRLCELARELSGQRFAFAKFSVVIPRVPGADDHGIDREIVMHAISQQAVQ